MHAMRNLHLLLDMGAGIVVLQLVCFWPGGKALVALGNSFRRWWCVMFGELRAFPIPRHVWIHCNKGRIV